MPTPKELEKEAHEYAKEHGVTKAWAIQQVRRKHGQPPDGSKPQTARKPKATQPAVSREEE